MPVTAPIIRVAVRWTMFGEPAQNVGYFYPIGAAFLTATCSGVAEAVWQDFKTAYRAIMLDNATNYRFKEVFVEELGGGMGLGTYPIPAAEQTGLRAIGGSGTPAAVWNSVSAKLVVGGRATRPGGKRFSPILDQDADEDRNLGATLLSLAEDWAACWSEVRTLGVPVATGTLQPKIVTLTSPLTFATEQDVIGHYINTKETHQTTRGN